MYEYLTGLSEGDSYAVVNTEGNICVLASEDSVKQEVVLRHYAFLLDYMSVPVDKILFISLDDYAIANLTKRFKQLYKDLPCDIRQVSDEYDIVSYDYVIVRDAHNVDIFQADWLKDTCSKAKNLYLFINSKKIRKIHNRELAEILDTAPFDFEISTDGNYCIAKYLHEVKGYLELARSEREIEKKKANKALSELIQILLDDAEEKYKFEQEIIERERKEAERRERERAERKAAAERAFKEAQQKAKEEKERKLREEEERKRKAEEALQKAEEAARRKAEEELRRKQNTPYFKKLKPYMDWYQKYWEDIVYSGMYKWEAVQHFQKHFNIDAVDLKLNLQQSFAKCGRLHTGVLLRSQKTLEKCAGSCPNETRLLLKNLFNENDSFQMRMMLFRSQSSQIKTVLYNKGTFNNEEIAHLTNVRAIATYLALASPAKHYIYRLFPFQQFCTKVKIAAPSVTEFEFEYEAFETICDQIRKALLANPDIIKLHDAIFNNDVSNYHILTFDFIYAVGQYLIALNLPPKI